MEILSHLQQYVPAKEYTRDIYNSSISEMVLEQKAEVRQLLFGGDQLTVARARGAMCNDTRLEGIIPVVEDWHAEVSIRDVIWKYLLTLNQLGSMPPSTSSKTS